MEMNLLNCLVVLILLYFVPCKFAAGSFSSKKVQNHLKFLNRTPLKSIKSPDGDIIDCIHISHQPAFDHPLLQNHKIQLRPKYYPEGKRTYSVKSGEGLEPIKQLWRANGECPQGTIPVRRTKKEDILRASSIKDYGKKKENIDILGPNSARPDPVNMNIYEHAIGYVKEDKYFGAKASINVWEPIVQQPNEYSQSHVRVLAGSVDGDNFNRAEAGWQVSEVIYGDNRTRLFVFWATDAYTSPGCYNMFCSGFIQTTKEIALGASISPVSSYGGSQFDITILIWKDPKSGNWWMRYGNDDIGYWPANLFTSLADGATSIQWGGEVANLEADGQHTSTQMGSGQFPGEGFQKASYVRNIEVVDGSNQLRVVEDLKTYADHSSCYDVQSGNNDKWDKFFYYGGPGRNPNCPT